MSESEVLEAQSVMAGNCTPECPCQSVHLVLSDVEGTPFGAIALSSADARKLARDLHTSADIADSQKARLEGRLA